MSSIIDRAKDIITPYTEMALGGTPIPRNEVVAVNAVDFVVLVNVCMGTLNKVLNEGLDVDPAKAAMNDMLLAMSLAQLAKEEG